jgi:cytochrome c
MQKNTGFSIASILFFLFLTICTTADATERSGEAIFQDMKCTKCHGTKAKQRGPSLLKIAAAYPDADALFLFFNGKTDPIVEPERAKTMRPRLRKIMKLNDTEQKALADYVISFKK